MAIAYLFACDGCAHEVVAWDDGNPYYFDDEGIKRHAWHPDELRERCVGIDTPTLCTNCCEEFDDDDRAPTLQCPSCHSSDIVELMKLEGVACPWCKAGTLKAKPGFHAIS